jgi:FkbH-like protein
MIKTLVISDFNAELACRYLCADRAAPVCKATVAPYGQVFQTLASPPADSSDVAFIWTRPEGVVSEYKNILEGGAIDIDRALAEVDAFAEAIVAFAARCRLVLIASWVSSNNGRGLGMLDWSRDGQAYCLARMNARLADALVGIKGTFLLDSQRWLDRANHARDEKYWHTMKSPFTEEVCRSAALDVKAAIRGADGLARKLLIVDLDNTLWGGEVGENGWQGINLAGHDAVGEAFVEFQRALKGLSRRGIALALASKNDEDVALKAINEHPGMILRGEDLAAWRINWNDKAQNIVELTKELNLGLQSVVFIDDNPTERGRVKEALPDVLVPDWPQDPTRFAEALRQLDCFDQPAITREDRARVRMYKEERDRKEDLKTKSSLEEWLNTLDIQITLEPVGESNIKRSTQLLNKTNQMNLRGRRLSESDLMSWLKQTGRFALAVSVADRFGDIGLTGLVSWQPVGDDIEIVDYVLSCRAMGRKVENFMASLVVDAARASSKRRVLAPLGPTERNRPCSEFWRTSGFSEFEPNHFVWDATKPYPKPDCISVKSGSSVA